VTTVDRSLPSGGVEGDSNTGGAQGTHPPTFRGLHGWTFLQQELDRNCQPPVTAESALRHWEAFVEAIRASGRPVVLLFAPEKSTMYPELLGPRAINRSCALRNKARMWSQIEAVRDPDIIGLRRPLLARKRSSVQTYLSVGTHWNDLGAVEVARLALERVGGPAEIHKDELVRGSARYPSDLSRFTGETEYRTTPKLSISREGVSAPFVRPVGDGTVEVSIVAPTHAPMIRGTTLLLADSFGDAPLAMLRHYADRMVNAHWHGQTPDELLPLIKQADTVILVAVERSFLQLPSDQPLEADGSIVTDSVIADLRRTLATR
jgi:hypothetical protein